MREANARSKLEPWRWTFQNALQSNRHLSQLPKWVIYLPFTLLLSALSPFFTASMLPRRMQPVKNLNTPTRTLPGDSQDLDLRVKEYHLSLETGRNKSDNHENPSRIGREIRHAGKTKMYTPAKEQVANDQYIYQLKYMYTYFCLPPHSFRILSPKI